jgi:hypothetical protein
MAEKKAVVERYEQALNHAQTMTTWECNTHGVIPVEDAYSCDIFHKIRRCKTCANKKSKEYKDNTPHRRVWETFVRRMQRKNFLRKTLRWKTIGQKVLAPLLLEPKGSVDWTQIKLVYSPKQAQKPIAPEDVVIQKRSPRPTPSNHR